MTKKESVWLIIRLIGVYFAYLTVISFFSAISVVPSLLFAPADLKIPQKNNAETPVSIAQPTPFGMNENVPNNAPTKSNSANADEKNTAENLKSFFWYVFLTAIYGVTGWYLLRDGRLFYALLMREEIMKKREAEPEVTTLNL